MALQSTVTYKGIEVPNCYIRVGTYNGDKNSLIFTIEYKANSDLETFYSKNMAIDIDLEGSNFIVQAYEYLKTLDEFADATDC